VMKRQHGVSSLLLGGVVGLRVSLRTGRSNPAL
jgi:hypothetical protein